ncbi:8-amino-7-oxononanoate synthase [Rhodanobacter thiooxydans]|uniref:8-amino-7-oxononanoate synthase n=1 Tax=Rhodanobacter thiooxydans TaxID=416169 RepID=A0A154QKM7_9GAMM|nr:8-amino-7-oxononanoate synthase [Rhodanobacter thiooxydans]EIL98595.1 8-amino-7-oxononanoate synthase [Rhodanobacter thiooxydans LCS2]KZC24307.1 8-amino-7-oxononanoate synthase [Rhodanobacter thiooxydans]MCW0201388.1 8-amino-7-oxononanoate synthase [Rhodanobacter thiooxydans]
MPRPDLLQRLANHTAERTRTRLLRRLHTIDLADGPWLESGSQRLLSFCSNDYLGLAQHPQLVAALTRAAREEGVGSTSAHLICGHRREHAELEEALAVWTGRECALLFSTGYMANLGVLQTLLAGGDVCVQDKLNHACLLDGAKLSGAGLKRYPHADVDAAARQLAANPDAAAMLATDGVFSMDGDVAPLRELAQLCARERATLMVDDAHGLGVLGAHGAGSLDAANLGQHEVPLLMATLGKALGCSGAFVAGPAALIEGLIQFARPYIYTTAMPPALAAAALEAVQLAQAETWRRDKLAALIARFRRGAAELGLPLAPSPSAIQPLLLGGAETALAAAHALERQGVLVTAIRPPTVPAGQARLRITLSAAHEEAHVDRLLGALETLHLPASLRAPGDDHV